MNSFKRTLAFATLATVLVLGFAARAGAQRRLPPDGGAGGGEPGAPALTAIEILGQSIFFDTALSSPDGQSCASCHDPGAGWADARNALDPFNGPTSEGAVAGRCGPRNSMPLTYADLAPARFFDPLTGGYIGGRYRDGRAVGAAEQGRIPFLSRLEMNNPKPHNVVREVRRSSYAPLFEAVFGTEIWNDEPAAFDRIVECLAAFQASRVVNRFNARFDRFRAGDPAALGPAELRGLALFEGRGGCAACHPSQVRADIGHAVFSNFRYYNLGVPKNPRNPFYDMPASLNPAGDDYVDLGLGGPDAVNAASEWGKFKVPSLRNSALTPPYMHNGALSTLFDAVMFHNTRDTDSRWGPPEVPVNIATGPVSVRDIVSAEGPTLPPEPPDGGGEPGRLGNLLLSVNEVEDIVAFLETLSDGPVPQ